MVGEVGGEDENRVEKREERKRSSAKETKMKRNHEEGMATVEMRKRQPKGRGEGKEKNKGGIGSRTESFGLACLACYDGISEMAEPRLRHKKRLTMQKTLHPVAALSSGADFRSA